MSSARTLFFAYDAGSANVTMAHAYKLHEQGFHVEVYPLGPAIEIYKKHIPHLIKRNYEFSKEDTVVLGTSGIHSEYEMQVLKEAKKAGVAKTIVILDSIDAMETRFLLDTKPLKKDFYPDEIWTQKIPLEFDLSQTSTLMKKIEDPYLEFIHSNLYKSPLELTNTLVKRFQGEYLVILSEYVRELFGDKFGFDEFDSVQHILKAVEMIGVDIPVLIKTHPAEPKNKYDTLISHSVLNIHKYDGDIHELVYYSKVVLGINSSVFHETIFLNKPTYSVQIGSCEKMEDILPSSQIIYDAKELSNMLHYHFIKGEH